MHSKRDYLWKLSEVELVQDVAAKMLIDTQCKDYDTKLAIMFFKRGFILFSIKNSYIWQAGSACLLYCY